MDPWTGPAGFPNLAMLTTEPPTAGIDREDLAKQHLLKDSIHFEHDNKHAAECQAIENILRICWQRLRCLHYLCHDSTCFAY